MTDQRKPHLDRSTVHAWLREHVQECAHLLAVVEGDGERAALLAAYSELSDALGRAFPAHRYGITEADLDKVVLDLLDPLHKRWPDHPLVVQRPWPSFNPERNTF